MTSVGTFFTALVTVVYNLLAPASGALTSLQILMWAGLILGFIPFVVGLIKRLAKGGE